MTDASKTVNAETLKACEAGARWFEIRAGELPGDEYTAGVFKVYAKHIRKLVALHTGTCEWKEDMDAIWNSACGNAHEFTMYGPIENKFTHCPYCSKRLVEKPYAVSN